MLSHIVFAQHDHIACSWANAAGATVDGGSLGAYWVRSARRAPRTNGEGGGTHQSRGAQLE